MTKEMIEYYHNSGKMPDWVYYQVNGKTAQENYIEIKNKNREKYRKQYIENFINSNNKENIEKELEKEIEKALDNLLKDF